jgi:hypothetical protein
MAKLEVSEEQAIVKMIGTDGLERLLAIANVLPKGNSYREDPFILACHLFNRGVEQLERDIFMLLFQSQVKNIKEEKP